MDRKKGKPVKSMKIKGKMYLPIITQATHTQELNLYLFLPCSLAQSLTHCKNPMNALPFL